MIDPFYSPKRKLARAKKHLADLEAVRESVIDEQSWTLVTDCNFDGGHKEFKIRFARDVADIFGDIAFDALHNLRAVLDHAAHVTARLDGKFRSRRACFPFGDTPHDLENSIKGRSKDIPPDILTVIREFKPYRTGNLNPLLWALNNAVNEDKHFMVCPVFNAPQTVNFGGPEGAIRPLFAHPPIWDRAKNEIIWVWLLWNDAPGIGV